MKLERKKLPIIIIIVMETNTRRRNKHHDFNVIELPRPRVFFFLQELYKYLGLHELVKSEMNDLIWARVVIFNLTVILVFDFLYIFGFLSEPVS